MRLRWIADAPVLSATPAAVRFTLAGGNQYSRLHQRLRPTIFLFAS